MKKIQIDEKDYILVTPKQLERMADWFGMACNCGDNDITNADCSLSKKCWDILRKSKTNN